MRLALTAGGTAGHIFPALAVYDALAARADVEADVRFFGPEDRGERTSVEAHGLAFEGVPAAPVRGRGPVALAQAIARLAWGLVVAVRRLRAFNPDAVFSTGGYGSFPCAVAARVLRRPLVVYLPDVSPGWAVRAEQWLATRMATTTESALSYLPKKKTIVTGYPVRSSFFQITRESARKALDIPRDARVVLIAGASQGAQAINAVVFAALSDLTDRFTILHITGQPDLDDALERRELLSLAQRQRYVAAAFREDMPTLMVAADLAVMRAGASVLGELPAVGLPAILIPATYAGGHQRENARWLERGGAAVLLREADLQALPDRIEALFATPGRLDQMAAAARKLAVPGGADAIAGLILEVCRK
jgi:UDP-N-acetylglucosamine--N-acetylmuramyl-(pentapeptide) pyrophosphoryl-undecaprenol N-acetylglucosamine transferase